MTRRVLTQCGRSASSVLRGAGKVCSPLGLLLSLLLLTVLLPAASHAQLADTKIAFTSGSENNAEIYVINPDGTGQTNLTINSVEDRFPAWSPDGTKIAFTSYRDGNAEIYVMNADGSGLTNLTMNPEASDFQPAWSPDGTKIVFGSYSAGDGDDEIYVMNADGSGQTRLTDNSTQDAGPAWSPDGTKIAFWSERDGNGEIYVMNADGSGPTNLTNHPAEDYFPAWSPDGTKIAFTSYRDGASEIYVMNADGTGQTNLTNNNPGAYDEHPAWSPDGTKIAFQSWSFLIQNYEIYVMNADGSGQTRLTTNSADDSYPAWSPVPGPPPAPLVVIEPEKVNFGDIVIGRRQPGQVQIRNDGDAPAMITGYSGPQGEQGQFFDVFFNAVSFPYALQPGGELIGDVGFSPGDDAQYNSFFDIFLVGEPEPRTVNLCGQGLPRVAVPEKLNFGYVYTGQTSSTVLYVTNQSDDPITISGVSEPQGEHSSFFDVFVEEISPRVLQPNESLAIHASFSPGEDILYNSFFDIFTNEPAHPEMRVRLCGQGVRPYSMIHVVDAFGSPGGHAVVDVVLNTDQWFAGLQFKIQPYCNGTPSWYVHFNGLINDLESDGWTASFHTDQNGVTTVLFFHTGGGSLSPYEEHRILELVFDIDPNIPFGKWIDLVTWDVVLSNPGSEPIPFTLWPGTIHIGHPGDIAGGQLGGGDGHPDILDLIKLVKKLIGLLPQPEWGSFEFFLCDVNGDGYINILDLVALINNILNEQGTVKVIADGPTRPVTVSLADVQTLAGTQLAVPVTLSANGSVAGVQATFTFDAAQLSLGTPQLVGTAAGMTLQSRVVDGTLRVLIYSATGQVIPAGSGAMLVIPATLLGDGAPELTLADVLLADRGAQAIPVVLGTSTVKVAPLPTAFALKSARPNPFNPTTRVAYDVPKAAHIVLAVYNLLGQEVLRLVDAEQQPGRYELVWHGRNAQGLSVASGVYLYRLTSSTGFSETKRMTLLK